MRQKSNQQMWDLWNLKSLFPDYGDTELVEILAQGKAFDSRQEDLFHDPRNALARLENTARDFMTQNSELQTGLVISLHLGPYSLAPVPWLLAGIDLHILINKRSLAKIKPIYDGLQKYLTLPGRIIWVPIEGPHFALKIVRALRKNNPVFAFLDGNDGLGGSKETLNEGMSYNLPGRNIKVRTGLARLASRCGSPVHSVVTRWPATGPFNWERGPTWHLNPGSPTEKSTKALYDWAFGIVKTNAAQWKCWNMLTGVYESFAEETIQQPMTPFADSASVKWTGQGQLWPGDMIEDLSGNCFYAAGGLSPCIVQQLMEEHGAKISVLKADFGDAWVAQQVPRLAALGFIALL